MATRFNISEADNYGGQGGGGFFSLKSNHEVAQVRFLYNGIEDVEGFAVHELMKDNNPKTKKNVSCLRNYGDPIDNCPFCKAGMPVKVKYFIPLYNATTGRNELWERGKKFGGRLASICSRYPNLISHIFEIERNGEAGDQQTSYEIYEVGSDDKTLADFEAPNDPVGTLVLDKTADEMQYYVDRKVFPDEADAPTAVRHAAQNDGGIVRRTPATSERREVF